MFINKIIIGIFLSIFQINLIYGCTCPDTPHPQNVFCESDFVLAVNPISYEIQDHKIEITVDIIKVYKENESSKPGILTKKLYTNTHSSACGINLPSNITWLIAGNSYDGRISINVCQYIRTFDNTPKFIIEGFSSLYEKGCHCNIYNIEKHRPFHPPASNETCAVEYSRCYVDHSACLPDKEGMCQWIKNDDVTKCLNETS